MDEISLDQITITMVREKKPVKLLEWFIENGYTVRVVFKGIYYVTRDNHFMTQLIVSKELSKENQKWLPLLSKDLDKTDVQRVAVQIESLKEDRAKQYVDSVLQVAMQENEETFNNMKEEENMCEALRKFFEPEMNEAIDKAVAQDRKEMACNALKNGSSAQEIAKVMGIPLAEVEAIAKGI